jgi:hypothetical protein
MYFATLNLASGDLVQLRMTPMHIRKRRLNRANPGDARWLRIGILKSARVPDHGSAGLKMGAFSCAGNEHHDSEERPWKRACEQGTKRAIQLIETSIILH